MTLRVVVVLTPISVLLYDMLLLVDLDVGLNAFLESYHGTFVGLDSINILGECLSSLRPFKWTP